MKIQVNTDHTIEGHEALAARIKGVVENALSRMTDHITRVEVHLTDESGPKSRQKNKRCMMELASEAASPSRSPTQRRLWTWPSTALQISWPD
ncbi:MAG: hypothetical protein WBW53_20460 [Terriglobales bacterium]